MTPSRWTHYTVEELACRCCEAQGMNGPFMLRAVALRDALGFALPVNSGYRCLIHNNEVGGGPAHPLGVALDFGVCGADATLVIRTALSMNFRGVGIRQHGPPASRLVHVDDWQERKRQLIWTY